MGDLISAPGNGGSALIDSITYGSINGISTRIQWSKIYGYDYFTIEGIGSSHSFPFSGYGEWGMPTYTMLCYSKNGFTYYPDSTISSCVKLYPLQVAQLNSLENSINITGNKIWIDNRTNDIMNLKVYSMEGKILASFKYGIGKFVEQIDNFSTGIYFVKCEQNEKSCTYKMVIE